MFATHPALTEAVSYPRPFGIHLFILFVPRFLVLLVGLTYWQLFLSSWLLERQIGKNILMFALHFVMNYKLVSRCFDNIVLVCTYSLLAMLSKETGVMILPIVIIYQLCCREGISTTLYRDKDVARTLLKYAATVSGLYTRLFSQ